MRASWMDCVCCARNICYGLNGKEAVLARCGTECYHINENARVINALSIIIITVEEPANCHGSDKARQNDNEEVEAKVKHSELSPKMIV